MRMLTMAYAFRSPARPGYGKRTESALKLHLRSLDPRGGLGGTQRDAWADLRGLIAFSSFWVFFSCFLSNNAH